MPAPSLPNTDSTIAFGAICLLTYQTAYLKANIRWSSSPPR